MKKIILALAIISLSNQAQAQAPMGQPGAMPEQNMEQQMALENADYKPNKPALSYEAMETYFSKNIKIDDKIKNLKILTSLVIEASVDSLGTLSNFTITQSSANVLKSSYAMETDEKRKGELNMLLGYAEDLDKEALRVATTLPPYTPATRKDKPVASSANIMVVIRNK
jgi:hypothetical protein